jgi:hypothetical protein
MHFSDQVQSVSASTLYITMYSALLNTGIYNFLWKSLGIWLVENYQTPTTVLLYVGVKRGRKKN